jgi:hypothetical protein
LSPGVPSGGEMISDISELFCTRFCKIEGDLEKSETEV